MKQTVFTCLSKEETLLFKSVNLDLIIKVRFLRQLTGQKQQLFTELQNDNENKSVRRWNTAEKIYRTFFGNYFVGIPLWMTGKFPYVAWWRGGG